MTVLIDDAAHAGLVRESAKRRSRETGGPLFGFADGDDAVVVCAYGPGPGARHRRSSFEPDRETTRALMSAVREASEKRLRFLGSWHTHPGGAAVPSARDISTAREMADDPAVILPSPLLLIQATRSLVRGAEATDLMAWRWDVIAQSLVADPIETVDLETRWCPVVCITRRKRRYRLVG